MPSSITFSDVMQEKLCLKEDKSYAMCEASESLSALRSKKQTGLIVCTGSTRYRTTGTDSREERTINRTGRRDISNAYPLQRVSRKRESVRQELRH